MLLLRVGRLAKNKYYYADVFFVWEFYSKKVGDSRQNHKYYAFVLETSQILRKFKLFRWILKKLQNCCQFALNHLKNYAKSRRFTPTHVSNSVAFCKSEIHSYYSNSNSRSPICWEIQVMKLWKSEGVHRTKHRTAPKEIILSIFFFYILQNRSAPDILI